MLFHDVLFQDRKVCCFRTKRHAVSGTKRCAVSGHKGVLFRDIKVCRFRCTG